MALVWDEQQQMLQDSASVFINENAPVAHLRELRDGHDADGYSRPLWKRFGEMGFAGVLVRESFGGLGLGQAEAGVLMQSLGRTIAPSPLWSTGVVAASAIGAAGSDAQKQAWLPRIAAADCVIAFAVDEGVKHRPDRIATRVGRAAGDGLVLNGSKAFVVDGHVADLLIVAAAGPDDGAVTLLLVDPKAEGVTIERTIMADAHNAARVRFDGVALPADAVLGGAAQLGRGAATLARVLDVGRAAAAAELQGLSDEVFARTVGYLKERKQFGRLIGEYQALQHRAAILYTEIEVSRAAVLNAAQRLDASSGDAGSDEQARAAAAKAVIVAKARAGASATLAVQEGVQMHGGMGMTEDLDFGLFMKRARVLQELFGDSEYQADRFAAQAGY
ncbi:MAG: acyl-CoA dehydrogenase family protein [Burkholderiaceae bacterium]